MRDVSTDEGLQRFIESLPDEAELRAELGDVLPQRRCAACQTLLPLGSRRDRRTCSTACRTWLYEHRHPERLRLRRLARRQQHTRG